MNAIPEASTIPQATAEPEIPVVIPPPVKLEEQPQPEVTQVVDAAPTGETKFQEAEAVLHTAVNRQRLQAAKEKTPNSPQLEAATAFHLFTLHKLNPGMKLKNPVPLSEGTEYRVRLNSGNYVAVEKGGFLISTILTKEDRGADGVYFQCQLKDNTETVSLRADELIRAQIMSEGDMVVSSLPEGSKQRELATEYVAAQKKGEVIALESDGLVEKAAKEATIPSSEAMRRLVVTANEHKQIDPETTAKLLKKLDGTTIVTQETAGEILATIDITGSQLSTIDGELTQKKALLATMKTQIGGMPDGESKHKMIGQYDFITGEVAGLEAQQVALQELQDALNELPGGAEAAITNLLTPLYEGTMDPDQAQAFLSALQNNEMEQMLKNLVLGLEKDDPENKYIGIAKNALKYGTLGTLAIVALMIMQGMQAGK